MAPRHVTHVDDFNRYVPCCAVYASDSRARRNSNSTSHSQKLSPMSLHWALPMLFPVQLITVISEQAPARDLKSIYLALPTACSCTAREVVPTGGPIPSCPHAGQGPFSKCIRNH